MADSFPQRPPSPKPVQTQTHTHTLSPVDGSSDPGAGLCRDGNMPSADPEGDQLGWKVTAESSHCLSVCVFLAVKTTGKAPEDIAAPGPRLTPCHLLTAEKTGRKETQKSVSVPGHVPVGQEESSRS